jgi:hypothetical protein
VVICVTAGIEWFTLVTPVGEGGRTILGHLLILILPVGGLTFALWAVHAAIRWAGGQPAAQRRGVLKWVFIALLAAGVGLLLVNLAPGGGKSAVLIRPDTNQWIRFTFMAVELREAAGVRWLAIDYLDEVHGACQKSFPWETKIPGFKAQTRTSEFAGGGKDSPSVRHQRVEYRMPDSVPRDQLEKLRDDVAATWLQKTVRLEMGEQKLLFELISPEGGSLKGWLKVVPPLKLGEPVGSVE